jgi:hypothetical protein
MDTVFENGTRADISGGLYLHHVTTIDLSKQEKTWLTGCSGCAPKSPDNATDAVVGGLDTFIGGAVVSPVPRTKLRH